MLIIPKEVIIIYNKMLIESKRLDAEINTLQTQISKLPPGKLICTLNTNRYKWYQSDGHTKVYIPKKNLQLAQELARKKYLSLLLDDKIKEKRAIEFYLKHYPSNIGRADELLIQESEYKKLLTPYFTPLSQELLQWQNSSYDKNPNYPEQLIHKSTSGNFVRSKSEAIIDMFLYNNKIPFQYECALQLDETIIYPDFTIRHPKTGTFYYWEHFGMMDDPNYCRNACLKMQTYTSNGIIPTVHLIMTFETREHPLSTDMIEGIVEYYFK